MKRSMAIIFTGLIFVAAGNAAPPTFNKDIAPILYQHCATCHRPGEVAPFSLLTYQDASKRASLIASVTERRYMPPWKAEPNYGHFADERRLTDAQLHRLKNGRRPARRKAIRRTSRRCPHLPMAGKAESPIAF